MADNQGAGLRTIIIGAGMAGMLAAIKLLERGETNFTIYEKGASVGGTWRENTYPGLSCDTPAHSYSYSFALNPEWSAFFAPGAEIKAYFEGVADRFGLAKYTRFNSEIESCTWDGKQWQLRTKAGETDTADVVIAASGVLHHPSYPDIPGLESFERPCFHSARWDHSVPLEGKRIGVIGNGSTGVQIISALADTSTLVHFQRSPQWIMPCPDTQYTEEEKEAFRLDPAKIEDVRAGPDAAARKLRFTTAVIDKDSPEIKEMQELCEQNLENSIADPVLKEKLRPSYQAACKRLIYSAHYYKAVQKPSVYLENTAIERIEPTGVRMKNGTFHELDVLVLATGFNVGMFVRPMKFIGEGGVDLEELWAKGPRAYYAVTIPNFPNLFLFNGPTGPVGNFSLVDIAEQQWIYIDQLMDQIRSGACTALAPTLAALETYEAARNKDAMRTVFASGCKSWYLDANGIPQVWPWSYARFVEIMSRPQLDDYAMTKAA